MMFLRDILILARYQAQTFSRTLLLSFVIYHLYIAIYKCFNVLYIYVKRAVSASDRCFIAILPKSYRTEKTSWASLPTQIQELNCKFL